MAQAIDPVSAVGTSIRHWPRLAELATFAADRHGFGDTDGGFGITYPGDLDDFDRATERAEIPPGHVEVYGSWGPPDGYQILVPEALYLEVLAGILTVAGLDSEAARVRAAQAEVAGG